MTAHRTLCPRCRRPERVCYCAWVTPLRTRTRVVIVQHPRERDVPINTARIASLCLPDATLHVTARVDTPALRAALSDPARPAALLYPGPGARDVESDPPSGPVTLVVVDGTWSQAKNLVRDNPVLGALPRFAFRPAAPSEYRIRREPQEDYVSTLEALAHVLGVLEGEPARFEAMRAPFRAMVEAQLAFAASNAGRPSRHARPRARVPADPRRRLPALLREPGRSLVCVQGEANAWPYGTPERAAGADELVHWVACRSPDGERFEAVVAPGGPLAPHTARYVGLPAEAIVDGRSPEALGAAWRAFLRPGDVTCSWGTYAAKLLLRAGGELPERHVDLRVAARAFAVGSAGTMDEFLARHGVAADAPLGHGRAGTRLGELVAILRLLRG